MLSPARPYRLFFGLATLALIVACAQTVFTQTDDPTDGESDPIKLFERGQNFHAKGNLPQALVFYEAALKLRPEFPEAEYQRGIALVGLGRSPEAEKPFSRAIELRKDWSLPYSALGNLLARASRDKEAEPALRQAIKLGAKDFVTLDALSRVRSRTGDKAEALDLARRATEDENASASAWAWRGAMERSSGLPDAALSSLNRALELEPNSSGALAERAELRAAAHDYDHAIEDLKSALSSVPGNRDLSMRLAAIYQLAGNADEAERIRRDLGIAAAPPPSGRAFGNFVELVEGTPEEIDAAYNDDPQIARPAIEKLLVKNPKVATLWARLGEITRRSDPAKSAEAFRKANEIDRKNPKYATGYAAALIQARRFAEAEQILRQVIAGHPDEYTAHANLALALYELKRFAEAVPEYEWLAAARPEIAVTYFFMATARDNLGQYEQALDAYNQFLARADPARNKLDIEKVNLRLPTLRDQIKRGQGVKKSKP
jgi:tetratricopeptide (TPR) repeat protein